MRLFAKPIKSVTTVPRKGISPVIATMILVAVTITVAASIAYWMGGISGQHTRTEKLEILNVSLSKDIPSGNYTIVVDLRNTGSADATISMVYINGKPYDDALFVDKISVRESGGAWISSGSLEVAVGSGSSKTVLTRIVPTFGTMTSPPFTSGTTLDVNIHTAAGKDYQQMVILD